MKFKVCMEDEYNQRHELEPNWYIINSDKDCLDIDLKYFCEYVYHNMDGWEWMKTTEEKIVAVDTTDTNAVYKFTFSLEYNPTFYIHEVRKTV